MSSIKSVVISCAGIGSRLGLGLTKALLKINGRSLISLQLELFKDVEDLRIVVGFQANDIIEEVLKYRSDVTFIFNHRYFETKTGAILCAIIVVFSFISPKSKYTFNNLLQFS